MPEAAQEVPCAQGHEAGMPMYLAATRGRVYSQVHGDGPSTLSIGLWPPVTGAGETQLSTPLGQCIGS